MWVMVITMGIRSSAAPVNTAGAAWSHLVALTLVADTASEPATGWMEVCYWLTARVEQTSRWSALLDLGVCSDAEARSVVQVLLTTLARRGYIARAGIGPTLMLAQLVACTAAPDEQIALMLVDTAAFLRRVPVTVLPEVHPRGSISAEMVDRLQQYGLYTCGHLARLGEAALCRQFGTAGTFLAAVAAGKDAQVLHPTAPQACQRFRHRFVPAAPADRVLTALPRLADRIACQLRQHGRQAREIRLLVRWDGGGVQRRQLTLRQHTCDPVVITQELQRLFRPLFRSGRAGQRALLGELQLTFRDFAPVTPDQLTFWRTHQQQRTAAEHVADTLARRHGREVLLLPQLTTPFAIFSEERYLLSPAGSVRVAPESAIGKPAQRSTVPAPAPWSNVPQRLHWW